MNPSDIKQVEQELKTWPHFKEVFYVSPERAIEEFTGDDQNADNILEIFETVTVRKQFSCSFLKTLLQKT